MPRIRRWLLALGTASVAIASSVGSTASHAGATWLDTADGTGWNSPGMAVPRTQAVAAADLGNPRCLDQQRPIETEADAQVAAAGWYLTGEYHAGWRLTLVTGAGNFDGMCRPLAYQQFVFADGQFAGTVSPDLMDSRTDGAVSFAAISGADQLTVQFARYAPPDPLCCPSRETFATYTIDRSSGAPVLVLQGVFTQPTTPGATP